MATEASVVPEDLEQLRRRFEEFRKAQPGHSRWPESLWAAATELAKHYGVNPTARTLRLELKAVATTELANLIRAFVSQ